MLFKCTYSRSLNWKGLSRNNCHYVNLYRKKLLSLLNQRYHRTFPKSLISDRLNKKDISQASWLTNFKILIGKYACSWKVHPKSEVNFFLFLFFQPPSIRNLPCTRFMVIEVKIKQTTTKTLRYGLWLHTCVISQIVISI